MYELQIFYQTYFSNPRDKKKRQKQKATKKSSWHASAA